MQQIENFASAGMMRLVAAGLEKQGLKLRHAKPSAAHVQRAEKSSLLRQLRESHGPMAVLALSDAVPDMPAEPVVLALRRARDLADLLQRWRRIEVFSHGSNRVICREMRDGSFELRHVGTDDKSPPSMEESLLVLSVITRLGELTCRQPLTATLSNGQKLRHGGNWRRLSFDQWDQ